MFKRKKLKGSHEPKAVLLLSERPDIEALDKKLTEIRTECDKKLAELQAMAEHIVKSYDERYMGVWTEVEAAARPVLPANYSREKYVLQFRNGALTVGVRNDDCDCPICRLADLV